MRDPSEHATVGEATELGGKGVLQEGSLEEVVLGLDMRQTFQDERIHFLISRFYG